MAWSDIFIDSGNLSATEQAAEKNRLEAEFDRRRQERLAAGTLTPERDP